MMAGWLRRFFGAYWTLCVVGTILALVVGLQSSVACCYLCCSRELGEGDEPGRLRGVM